MQYIPANTSLDPLGAALGQGLGQGLMQGLQQKWLMSDQQKMLEYLAAMKRAQAFGGSAARAAVGGGIGGLLGSMAQPDMTSDITPPNLRTPEMQRIMLQLELGKMLNPMQQAQIRNLESETQYNLAKANASGLSGSDVAETVVKGSDGSFHKVLVNKLTGATIQDLGLASPKDTGEPAEYDIIRPIGTRGGGTQYIKTGSEIPPNYEVIGKSGVSGDVNPPSAVERKDIASGQSGLDMISELKTAYDLASVRGKPGLFGFAGEFPGPIQGPYREVAGAFGKTEPKTERFLAASTAFANKVIKLITGAQMSEPEARRIMRQIPRPGDPNVRWQAKYNFMLKDMTSLQDRYLEAQRKSGLTPVEFDKHVDEQVNSYSTKPPEWLVSSQTSQKQVEIRRPDGKVFMVPEDKVEITKRSWGIQ